MVEEEIDEDITETHEESVDFGGGRGGGGDVVGAQSVDGDTSVDGGGRADGDGGRSGQFVGAESLMSLGSVESEDLQVRSRVKVSTKNTRRSVRAFT